jgi:hypothetical protein
MEFTLIHRGPLKANGGPVEKQSIRRAIHRQMQILWNQEPRAADIVGYETLGDIPPGLYNPDAGLEIKRKAIGKLSDQSANLS